MNKVLFFVGAALVVVPLGIRLIVNEKQKELVASYEKQWSQTEDTDREICLEKARIYNERLYENGLVLQDEYEEQLNLLGNGVMGSLEIPKINLKLPVCHGTSEEVLSNSIGHLIESSLPIGGINSHCVLSGHRGLPNAELFTRLDELEKGDLFFVNVSSRKLGYQVSKIQIVEPEEVECVRIQEGKDLMSLVTCTPYGLNTHRLVITGERIYDWKEEDREMKVQEVSNRDKLYLLIPIIFIVAVTLRKIKKWIPFLGIALLLGCPMEVLAADNCIEVQFPEEFSKNNSNVILCTKVGEKMQSEYVLLEEFAETGIDLNNLNTAKELEEAANVIGKKVKSGFTIPIDQKGHGLIETLEDGVYLMKCQSTAQKNMLPILIYLPFWSEKDQLWCSEVIVTPKLNSNVDVPDTGWDTNEIPYLILLCLSLGVISVGFAKKYVK